MLAIIRETIPSLTNGLLLGRSSPLLNHGFKAYLEELVMVELDPVLQPGDLRSRDTDRHAEERYLPAQHVIQLEVGRLHDLGTLRKKREKNPWQMVSRDHAH